VTDKAFSSLARMLGVLDLFTEEHPVWSAEAVAEALEVSIPTAYRYVKLLVESGLLQRSAESQYSLGPRIIVLDHFIRAGDPVLQHAIPFMQELVETTGFDCVLSGLYGQQVLDTHREYGKTPADLGYGRGRPRPLFLGGAPKVILSCFTPTALHKVFDQRRDEIAQAGLPTEWPTFRKYYSNIRKTGHYLSLGELEPNLAALAAPLQKADGTVLGAISLVTTVQRMAVIDAPKLAALVMRCAGDIAIRVP
jgi:DNA-binding IclR family transcriptional regulator